MLELRNDNQATQNNTKKIVMYFNNSIFYVILFL